MENFKPNTNRILVRPCVDDPLNKDLLRWDGSPRDGAPIKATVIAVGPDVDAVKVGDVVLFHAYRWSMHPAGYIFTQEQNVLGGF